MKTLKGSVAVVTGAGSGIGRGLAQELASHGAELALADVNSAALEETRSLLGSTRVKTYSIDVSEASAVGAFARQVEQDFGRVSVLINNAGVALFGSFADLTLEEFDWLFRINFWGVVHGCKFFLPLLKREPEAHIVNISSAFGLIAPAEQTAYSSSKFAVRGFTQSLRQELQGTGIGMTSVHPGGVRTNIAANARAAAAARPEGWVDRKERFLKLARTSPEKAAQIIVQGILRNKGRVLIGPDAYQFDFLARMFPVRCASIIAAMFNRMFREIPQQATAVKEKESST
jgi:NAD(P)-dependent dehydrogenase (short-subunit alcohol dehydrogenase family)